MQPPVRLLAALTLLLVTVLPPVAPPASGALTDDDPVGVWPLVPQPEVVARFDPPTSPYGPGHRGVDLLGHVGQRVRTALAGTVTFAGMLAGRGVVVVDHGDTRTTYEPLAATVSVGARVGRGAAIGTLQGFGSHCAPRSCLHWGWLRGDTYLDPLLLVGAGPVRLLPLWRDLPVTARGTPWTPPALPYARWRPPARPG
ncbi:murein hydrolase activator EnvC [Nocardioides sp. MH1]|uniref:murein hydrolase activator EnvC family protein n=1 Tax=Nocardioides sp. MH1 TaxID=3242490 RepID=UPI0035204166